MAWQIRYKAGSLSDGRAIQIAAEGVRAAIGGAIDREREPDL